MRHAGLVAGPGGPSRVLTLTLVLTLGMVTLGVTMTLVLTLTLGMAVTLVGPHATWPGLEWVAAGHRGSLRLGGVGESLTGWMVLGRADCFPFNETM